MLTGEAKPRAIRDFIKHFLGTPVTGDKPYNPLQDCSSFLRETEEFKVVNISFLKALAFDELNKSVTDNYAERSLAGPIRTNIETIRY